MKLCLSFVLLLTHFISINAQSSTVPELENCMNSVDDINNKKLKVDFEKAVINYLDAVKNRQGDKALSYVSKDLPMAHVLPGPRVLTNFAAYEESQRPWHEGSTGNYDYKIQSLTVTPGLGFASIIAFYDNIDSETQKPFSKEIYISFLFKHVDGSWLMIHSQNSVLKEVR
jgi:hypothetical protein